MGTTTYENMGNAKKKVGFLTFFQTLSLSVFLSVEERQMTVFARRHSPHETSKELQPASKLAQRHSPRNAYINVVML